MSKLLNKEILDKPKVLTTYSCVVGDDGRGLNCREAFEEAAKEDGFDSAILSITDFDLKGGVLEVLHKVLNHNLSLLAGHIMDTEDSLSLDDLEDLIKELRVEFTKELSIKALKDLGVKIGFEN